MSNRTLQPRPRSWATAIENASFGVWDLDPGLDSVHYSPQWKTRLGFPRIDAPDNSAFWRCRVHPDDVNPMLGALRSHWDGCTSTYEATFRLRSNGSGYRTMLSRGRVIARNELGHAARMIGTMVDLTGWPASAAPYGLATELPAAKEGLHRLPFHAVIGRPHPFHRAASDSTTEASREVRASCEHEQHHWVELIDDLLDAAWREANAAP